MGRRRTQIPSFYYPHGVPDITHARVRPLARCDSCGYVLCNFGNCHSQECGNGPCTCGDEDAASDDTVEMSEHMREMLDSLLDE